MKLRLCCLAGLMGILAGCASTNYIAPEMVQTHHAVIAPELPPRELKAGDRLQLVFMSDVKRNSQETYRLDNLDEVELTVRDRPDLSGSFVVVPNGWLYAPLLEPIKVKNMTLQDVQRELETRYRKHLDAPQVSVALKRYNRNVEAFISGLAQASSLGPVYEVSVDRDGSADFPLIGTERIGGMTLGEASEHLVRQYKESLPGVEVSVRLVDNNNDLVAVLGEVKNPVTIPVNGSLSLGEALGYAGGWTREAAIAPVLTVQPRGDVVHVCQYDLQTDVLAAAQVKLVGGDMVYVPRSIPADINILVDQLIRRNIPVNANVSYNISQIRPAD